MQAHDICFVVHQYHLTKRIIAGEIRCVMAQSHRICRSTATALRQNKSNDMNWPFAAKYDYSHSAWWRHQMETFPRYRPFVKVFPAQRPVTRSFDVFFDHSLDKRLSKQSRGWWFETQSHPLWSHCNGMVTPKCYRSVASTCLQCYSCEYTAKTM